MSTRKNWFGQGVSPSRTVEATSVDKLSDTLASRLLEKFPSSVRSNVTLGNSFADLVIEKPDFIVVAELKMGDPTLPLPSSTVPQMKLFVEQAHSQYPQHSVLPIVVTNYQVSDVDKSALSRVGVKILNLTSPINVDSLISQFVQEIKTSEEEPRSAEA